MTETNISPEACERVAAQGYLIENQKLIRALVAEVTRLRKALRALLSTSENDAVVIDGEWGAGRTLEQLYAGNEVSAEIIAARAALAPMPAP